MKMQIKDLNDDPKQRMMNVMKGDECDEQKHKTINKKEWLKDNRDSRR